MSELMGALLTIAITLTAGVAMFGYVNNQLGVSGLQLGQAVGGTINSLRESFVVVNTYFPSAAPHNVTITVFNNGKITLNITDVIATGNMTTGLATWPGTATFGHDSITVANANGTLCVYTSPEAGETPGVGSKLLGVGAIGSYQLAIPGANSPGTGNQCAVDYGFSKGPFTIQAVGSNGYVLSVFKLKV